MLLYEPQQLLHEGWAVAPGTLGVVLVMLGYAVCAAALLPRPVLNLAVGALLGAQSGLLSALAGTVLAAAASFGLGRLLGQEALRPLLRGRRSAAVDRVLSRHGFRSALVLRLVPGIPFAAVNYAAAVSRMSWRSFLGGTALGSIPNTAAYVIAGSQATTPSSPAFLIASGFVALSALATGLTAWRGRERLRVTAPGRTDPRVLQTAHRSSI